MSERSVYNGGLKIASILYSKNLITVAEYRDLVETIKGTACTLDEMQAFEALKASETLGNADKVGAVLDVRKGK